MKAIFIACSQAYNEEIIEVLESFGQRGYTRWTEVGGRGSSDGIPHLGSHAWPDMNHVVLTFVEDDDVAGKILEALHEKDLESKDLGLRAFVWNIEKYC